MKKTFWMVLGKGEPHFRHTSEESASREAERLAGLYPGFEFVVLESVKSCKKPPDVLWVAHHPEADDDGIPF